MIEELDFDDRKEKLIDCYLEYISELRKLNLSDMGELEKFTEMSLFHSKAASASMAFFEFLKTYLDRKNINNFSTSDITKDK